MKLYLDDDSVKDVLVKLLRKAGHDVQVPAQVGLSGESDPVHLAHAVRQARVFLSYNHDDFEALHDLLVAAQGHHPGILIIRRDNDARRDMSERGIVLAIAKLQQSSLSIESSFYVLNHWR